MLKEIQNCFKSEKVLYTYHEKDEVEKIMKCVICKSPDIQMKMVEEEVKAGRDVVLIPMEVLVCINCGERYYDRKTMQKIENLREKLRRHDLEVEEVGKVLLAHTT